ncbi:imidazole glycerol phosphate synthase subunit HisH [Geovibrio thiophilus]|uniref:Imidazole glycerol phosphate synthase subunit HisH n=1 Tax=Geovibrio thiophilus TaxID=139438 RepID=A0A410JUR2_9BACT|nr:imidazole glycerol phosphate synthase subunit HisH [Geovibrio thiophilus]QAR31957.1 imidazole glycerol phosphate synthase subunit HisH [Geovibrio thiophilus]
MSKIAIIDYEAGNLRSVQKAFESLGYDAAVTSDAGDIKSAAKVVLPGVGAFGDCVSGLERAGLRETVLGVIASGRPFLGICVGMQMLFDKSYEFGEHDGLGIFRGSVKKFPDEIVKQRMKIPHMGWNSLSIKQKNHPVLNGINDGDMVYFVHSYYVQSEDAAVIAAECDYGVTFTAAAARDNIFATQFHPEKSQTTGLRLLKNFGEWKC